MQAAARVDAYLAALEAEVAARDGRRWALALEAAGHALPLRLALREPFLRAEAAVLPPGLIEPRQLLFWNGQAPLVCFAESRDGEIVVCGELPLASLDAELLDRFLGLLVASAARAREFVLRGR